MRRKNCVLLPAADRRTQFFLLIFTKPGRSLLAEPCTRLTSLIKRSRQSARENLSVTNGKQSLALPLFHIAPSSNLVTLPPFSFQPLSLRSGMSEGHSALTTCSFRHPLSRAQAPILSHSSRGVYIGEDLWRRKPD